MKDTSAVLKEFQQLLEVKYTGNTPRNYTGHVAKFLAHAKNVPLRVTNDDVLSYNVHIRNKSNSYRNVAINAIKVYFMLYLKRRLKGFASIRPKKQRTIAKVLDAEVLAIKINAIQNLKHRAILLLGLSSWLRRSEVVNLKITDIHSDRMRIFVSQSKGAADREVKLSANTLECLRAYFKAYRPRLFLFSGQNALQYSGSSINAIAHQYLDTNFHTLRASGATYALQNGTDLKTVSEMLGHKSIETTKFYLPTLLQEVVQSA